MSSATNRTPLLVAIIFCIFKHASTVYVYNSAGLLTYSSAVAYCGAQQMTMIMVKDQESQAQLDALAQTPPLMTDDDVEGVWIGLTCIANSSYTTGLCTWHDGAIKTWSPSGSIFEYEYDDEPIVECYIATFSDEDPTAWSDSDCNDEESTALVVCEDHDECADPADNTCDQICTNTAGSFVCSCNTGYQLVGNTCEGADAGFGEYIDECGAPNDCEQICNNTVGSYVCLCSAGYTASGPSCTDINECASPAIHTCAHTCTNTVGAYSCSCNTGFDLLAGGSCIDINECNNPNQNNCLYDCLNKPGTFSCLCHPGFSGDGVTCVETGGLAKNVLFSKFASDETFTDSYREQLGEMSHVRCSLHCIDDVTCGFIVTKNKICFTYSENIVMATMSDIGSTIWKRH